MRIRAVIAACLVAVMAIAASLPAAAGRSTPSSSRTTPSSSPRTVALGISIWSGHNIGALDSFTESIGGSEPATWTIWSPWGDPDRRGFPTAAAAGARARGAVPVIWWEPYTPSDAGDTRYSRLRNIIDGDHDAYIRDYARAAKAHGGRILLRMIPQANSDYLPWAWDYSASDDNTIRTFKRAWRHVVGIFRDVRANNVRFVWSIATQTCKGDCLTQALGYPGDAYVHYMGFTWENWGDAGPGSSEPSQPWVSMVDGFRPIVSTLANVSHRPIVAVAIASGPDGGDKAAWIRNGYPAVYQQLPRVVAIMWLNVNLAGAPFYHRDWSLSGGQLDAYGDVAAMPEFQGRIP